MELMPEDCKKIFVTVGTTLFPSLTRYMDDFQYQNREQYAITQQIADCKYIPKNSKWFRFGDVESLYRSSDFIITHAGAGSIYKLLELGKKIIVVPNSDRRDKHQSEIARYVERNNFGIVCWRLSDLPQVVSKIEILTPSAYCKVHFHTHKMIRGIIFDSMGKNTGK